LNRFRIKNRDQFQVREGSIKGFAPERSSLRHVALDQCQLRAPTPEHLNVVNRTGSGNYLNINVVERGCVRQGLTQLEVNTPLLAGSQDRLGVLPAEVASADEGCEKNPSSKEQKN
jgi:hypothetical protein